MKIFKIGDVIPVDLRVDTHLITCDSHDITCDQTLFEGYGYTIKVIPRFTSNNFQMRLKNELTQRITIVDDLLFHHEDDYLVISFYYSFEEGDSFEITIYDTSTSEDILMWRGKGYATIQDDLENYKLIIATSNPGNPDDGIIIMD
jgi:hypothetical protein